MLRIRHWACVARRGAASLSASSSSSSAQVLELLAAAEAALRADDARKAKTALSTALAHQPEPKLRFRVANNLAFAEQGLGNAAEARRILEDNVSLARGLADPAALALALHNLGSVSEDPVRALQLLEEAQALRTPETLEALDAAADVAHMQLLTGRLPEALASLDAALARLGPARGDEPEERLLVRCALLGRLLDTQGRAPHVPVDEACRTAAAYLEAVKRAHGADSAPVLDALERCAAAHAARKESREALVHALRCVELWPKLRGADDDLVPVLQ